MMIIIILDNTRTYANTHMHLPTHNQFGWWRTNLAKLFPVLGECGPHTEITIENKTNLKKNENPILPTTHSNQNNHTILQTNDIQTYTNTHMDHAVQSNMCKCDECVS